jgi:hypothetical protein
VAAAVLVLPAQPTSSAALEASQAHPPLQRLADKAQPVPLLPAVVLNSGVAVAALPHHHLS